MDPDAIMLRPTKTGLDDMLGLAPALGSGLRPPPPPPGVEGDPGCPTAWCSSTARGQLCACTRLLLTLLSSAKASLRSARVMGLKPVVVEPAPRLDEGTGIGGRPRSIRARRSNSSWEGDATSDDEGAAEGEIVEEEAEAASGCDVSMFASAAPHPPCSTVAGPPLFVFMARGVQIVSWASSAVPGLAWPPGPDAADEPEEEECGGDEDEAAGGGEGVACNASSALWKASEPSRGRFEGDKVDTASGDGEGEGEGEAPAPAAVRSLLGQRDTRMARRPAGGCCSPSPAFSWPRCSSNNGGSNGCNPCPDAGELSRMAGGDADASTNTGGVVVPLILPAPVTSRNAVSNGETNMPRGGMKGEELFNEGLAELRPLPPPPPPMNEVLLDE